jgi:hypothetical protein
LPPFTIFVMGRALQGHASIDHVSIDLSIPSLKKRGTPPSFPGFSPEFPDTHLGYAWPAAAWATQRLADSTNPSSQTHGAVRVMDEGVRF